MHFTAKEIAPLSGPNMILMGEEDHAEDHVDKIQTTDGNIQIKVGGRTNELPPHVVDKICYTWKYTN